MIEIQSIYQRDLKVRYILNGLHDFLGVDYFLEKTQSIPDFQPILVTEILAQFKSPYALIYLSSANVSRPITL